MMPVIVNEDEFNELRKASVFKDYYDISKNDLLVNQIDDNTKCIIVGTMTPPHFNFFYCSNNKLYEYIDAYFNNNNLVNAKKEINAIKPEEKNALNERINNMKNILYEKGIVFLDVFKEVLRNPKKKESAADSDIIFGTLDYGSFDKIQNYNKIELIFDNHLAEKYIMTI